MQSLDELRRVIRRIETRRPPRPAAPPAHEVLGGELVETGAGPLLIVRREYPLTHIHGRQPLAPAFAAPLDLLSAVARAAAPARDPRGLLFLDTEPTGLAGGTGTYAFLVGVGHLDGDRVVVAQYFMRDFDEEPALLTALVPLLEQAAGVVTFNGSGFDLPLLETRFVLARRRWPALLPHLDLLRPARRVRSEEHTSELQSPCNLVCRLLLEKKKKNIMRLEHAEVQERHDLEARRTHA